MGTTRTTKRTLAQETLLSSLAATTPALPGNQPATDSVQTMVSRIMGDMSCLIGTTEIDATFDGVTAQESSDAVAGARDSKMCCPVIITLGAVTGRATSITPCLHMGGVQASRDMALRLARRLSEGQRRDPDTGEFLPQRGDGNIRAAWSSLGAFETALKERLERGMPLCDAQRQARDSVRLGMFGVRDTTTYEQGTALSVTQEVLVRRLPASASRERKDPYQAMRDSISRHQTELDKVVARARHIAERGGNALAYLEGDSKASKTLLAYNKSVRKMLFLPPYTVDDILTMTRIGAPCTVAAQVEIPATTPDGWATADTSTEDTDSAA